MTFRARFIGSLNKGKIGVIWHNRFRKGLKLHAFTAKVEDSLHDLVHGSFPTVEDRAQLYGSGFDSSHFESPLGAILLKFSEIADSCCGRA
jgi:hypothetical protein